MEEYRPNIVEMAVQGEETPPRLIRPYFDLVVVSSGDEQWLCLMKVNTSDRTIMLFKSVDQRAHTIVPKLNRRGVEGDENPWPEKC